MTREEAINILTELAGYEKTMYLIQNYSVSVQDALHMAIQALEQEQKVGHWIKKEDDTCWWYVCSECEQKPLKNRWNDDDVLSSFCPNCGAKMQEVEE